MVRVNSGARRGVALVAVILLHAGLVFVVVVALRTHGGTYRRPDAPTTLVFLNLPAPAAEQAAEQGQPSLAPARSGAITVPPLPSQPQAGPVDWDAAAQGAAAAVTAPPDRRSLGHNPATNAPAAAASPGVAVHSAGEQYRDPVEGTSIVYISDQCYLASSRPLLGTPDVIARAASSHLVCKGDPGWSRPDLFKDLPAYERYHPKDPDRP